jgi:hypothetical protein
MARSAYYHHLYPFPVVYNWLWASENLAGDLGIREFAFRFDSRALSRFQNFTDEAEFRLATKKANPAEIHFGGIYVCHRSYFYAKLLLKMFQLRKACQKAQREALQSRKSLSSISTLTIIQGGVAAIKSQRYVLNAGHIWWWPLR